MCMTMKEIRIQILQCRAFELNHAIMQMKLHPEMKNDQDVAEDSLNALLKELDYLQNQ